MTDEHSISEGGRDYGAFIPRMIDDYGLDPYEFRIYCRLERRIGRGSAGCFESIANMASSCKMSQQKVRNALQVLVLTGIAKQEKCKGKTDRYILMPPDHWVDSSHLDEIRLRVTAYRQESDAKSTAAKQNRFVDTPLRCSEPPHYAVVDTPLRCSDKGSPIKDLQLRISNEEEEAATTNQIQESQVDIVDSDPTPTAKSQDSRENLSEQPEDSLRDNFSADPEILKKLRLMSYDWRQRPWMADAVQFKPEVVQAVWQSNVDWYSIPGTATPNLKKISDRLKKLDSQLRALNTSAISAYAELQNYWAVAQAIANPEVEQAFIHAAAVAKQKSLQTKLNANKRATYDAIKDL